MKDSRFDSSFREGWKLKKLPMQVREFAIDRSVIDKENRLVSLSFSSDYAVERPWGTEILAHGPGNVRMGRLNNSAPLLVNHDIDKHIGVIESARIQDGKGKAVVRFSNSSFGAEVFQDVQDGIRTSTSVAYKIHKMQKEKQLDATVYRITDWEPFEVSIVTIPADPTVGVGRSFVLQARRFPVEILEGNFSGVALLESNVSAAVQQIRDRAAAEARTEAERVKGIHALAMAYGRADRERFWVTNLVSVDDVRQEILNGICAGARGLDVACVPLLPEGETVEREARGKVRPRTSG